MLCVRHDDRRHNDLHVRVRVRVHLHAHGDRRSHAAQACPLDDTYLPGYVDLPWRVWERARA